jgi:hypothetical protein
MSFSHAILTQQIIGRGSQAMTFTRDVKIVRTGRLRMAALIIASLLAVAGALLGTTLSPPDISNLRQNGNERRA